MHLAVEQVMIVIIDLIKILKNSQNLNLYVLMLQMAIQKILVTLFQMSERKYPKKH